MSNKVTYAFNPFTSQFDAIRPARPEQSESIVSLRNCLVGASIGDLVLESLAIVNGVDTSSDNTDIRPVIGIIISKPTTTTCDVFMLGLLDGFAGLTKGGKVFLETDGSITQTIVSTGYVQTLGIASDTDTINFNPQTIRVLRS